MLAIFPRLLMDPRRSGKQRRQEALGETMTVCRVAAATLLTIGLCLPGAALAEGLTKGSTVTLAADVPLSRNQQLSPHAGTPIPLRSGVFMLPFSGRHSGSAAVQYQAVDSSFAKLGPVVTVSATGGDNCCAGIAENGGAKLGGNRSLFAIPIFTFSPAAAEVFGYYVGSDGTPIDPFAPESPDWRLTRSSPGNQGGPVIVPIAGGTAFAMWTDGFPEAGKSERSVRGAFVAPGGGTIGPDILIEPFDTGSQFALDGVQLKNGRLLLVFAASNISDVLGRWQFYGRLMSANGDLIGGPFRIGASNSSTEMHVAALPNGDFIATWVDDRVGLSVPVFRIFEANGKPRFAPQPFDTYSTLGSRLDIAALSDNRFVITGVISDSTGGRFVAQLFTPIGQKVGEQRLLQASNNPEAVRENHLANAGYLLGQAPPAGGLATASDPRRVYVVWRLNTAGLTYKLLAVPLTATP